MIVTRRRGKRKEKMGDYERKRDRKFNKWNHDDASSELDI